MRILIVEDNFIIALCLEDMLIALGYSDVRSAHDLAAAHKLLGEGSPDFAILDVNIGKDVVFSFASILQIRNIPFLFSTGNPRHSFPAEWQAHHIVPKPVEIRSLEAELRAIGVGPRRAPDGTSCS